MSPNPRFDAYCASIKGGDIQAVIGALEREMGVGVRPGGQRRRYGAVLDLVIGADLVAWVGEDDSNGSIYIEAKGETTPEVVSTVRGYFPEHSVPRVDVCQDFAGEGVFEYLQEVVRATKGSKVRAGYTALPDDPKLGRTWAAGVRGGVAYQRLYEAGKQAEKAHWCRPDAVRFELEARPHYSRDKRAAARMSPMQVLGITPWSRRVWEAILRTEIERFEAQAKVSTHDRTTLYIARAFRRHWEELLADFGDWECIGRELSAVWVEDDEAKILRGELAS